MSAIYYCIIILNKVYVDKKREKRREKKRRKEKREESYLSNRRYVI
jgi:hypothetical protein